MVRRWAHDRVKCCAGRVAEACSRRREEGGRLSDVQATYTTSDFYLFSTGGSLAWHYLAQDTTGGSAVTEQGARVCFKSRRLWWLPPLSTFIWFRSAAASAFGIFPTVAEARLISRQARFISDHRESPSRYLGSIMAPEGEGPPTRSRGAA